MQTIYKIKYGIYILFAEKIGSNYYKDQESIESIFSSYWREMKFKD